MYLLWKCILGEFLRKYIPGDAIHRCISRVFLQRIHLLWKYNTGDVMPEICLLRCFSAYTTLVMPFERYCLEIFFRRWFTRHVLLGNNSPEIGLRRYVF